MRRRRSGGLPCRACAAISAPGDWAGARAWRPLYGARGRATIPRTRSPTEATTMIERRRLGSSTLEVSAIGLGCMSMSGAYGPGDDAQSVAVVHRALDLGVNFLDSADMYGWGHNETLLGQALRGRRERAVVVTKFGNMRKPDGTPGVDGRPEWVPQACDVSLKRRGVDVIDLYYQHRVDPKVPIEDTVGAMSRLVEAGKVRFLGLSVAAPATIRRAQKVHPLAAVQMEYSLLYRVEAQQTLPTLRELGISLVAYSPVRSTSSPTFRKTTGAAPTPGSRSRTSSATSSS